VPSPLCSIDTKIAFWKVFPDTVIGVTPQVLPVVALRVMEGQFCPLRIPEKNNKAANKKEGRAIYL
jgi:hypothetical protein